MADSFGEDSGGFFEIKLLRTQGCDRGITSNELVFLRWYYIIRLSVLNDLIMPVYNCTNDLQVKYTSWPSFWISLQYQDKNLHSI